MDKDVICDYGNLYKAYKKAKSGKKHNSSAAKFEAMSLEGLHMLKEQLENRSYRVNPYNEFEEVIENSKKTYDEIEAEAREVKKKIIAEILKEVLHEEDK